MHIPAPKKPIFDATPTAFEGTLRPEVRIEQAHLQLFDGVGIRADNMTIDESVLERVVFTQAQLEKLGLSDVTIKSSDMSAAKCAQSSWLRVHIKGGRLTGVDLSTAVLKDVVFEDCRLDMANFRSTKLTNVQFIRCQLIETDFQMAALSNVSFIDSELKKVELSGVTLKRVDARSSRLFDIRGWRSLKGLMIDSMQLAALAPELALELGLSIED